LIEHFAGYFPLWLAPVQAVILPITDSQLEYAKQIERELSDNGIRVELDDRNEKIGYKIREWETKKVPYMLVVGEKERIAGAVAVRQHKKGDMGQMQRQEFLEKAKKEIAEKLIGEREVNA
jgi:threonyl-tRNA synthetase